MKVSTWHFGWRRSSNEFSPGMISFFRRWLELEFELAAYQGIICVVFCTGHHSNMAYFLAENLAFVQEIKLYICILNLLLHPSSFVTIFQLEERILIFNWGASSNLKKTHVSQFPIITFPILLPKTSRAEYSRSLVLVSSSTVV